MVRGLIFRGKNFLQTVVAFSLCLMILLSSLYIGYAKAAEINVWDGTVSDIEDISGTGTEEDPYLITSGADLAYFAKNDGEAWAKYLKLTNDIYLNDTTKENWVDTANEWFEGTAQFGGVLNGAGYTIYGLYADSAATNTYCGLFQRVNGNAAIKDLHLRDVYIKAAFAGAFVGYAQFGNLTIEKCSVKGEIIGVSTGSTKVGGFVGYVGKSAVIKNSYINAEMNTTDGYGLLGSFIGTFWRASGDRTSTLKIETSYANTSRVLIDNCGDGNNVAVSDYVTINNVYSKTSQANANNSVAKTISGVKMLDATCKGENAKLNMTGFDFDNVWHTVDNDYPVNSGSGVAVTVVAWDGTVSALEDISGSGTEADPYLIKSGADLAYFAKNDGVAWTKYLKLTNDIYLNDTTKDNWVDTANEWYEGTAQFGGVLDGAGYTIYGLYADSAATNTYCGLFQRVNGNAVIKDLHLRDVNIKAAFAGAFVGYAQFGNLNIENCSVSGKITGVSTSNTKVGGYVGYAAKNTVIKDSYINAEMNTTQGYGFVGSFIGTFWPTNGDTSLTLTIETSYADTSRAVIENCLASTVTLTNVYSTTAQSAATNSSAQGLSVNALVSSCKGENAKSSMTGFDFNNVWYTVNGGYPVNRESDVSDTDTGIDSDKAWDGTVSAIEDISGSGTETDPYLIKSGADLAYFASTDGKSENKYLKLTEDIYLNDTTKDNWVNTANEWFEGTAQFGGVLDGAGYAIYGLYAESSATNTYCGLFQRSNGNAVIKNLHLRDVKIKAACAGAFVGYAAFGTLTIEKCSVSGEIIGVSTGSTKVGGFIGYAGKSAVIKNSYINATMNTTAGYGLVGSFIGTFWRASGDTTSTLKIESSYADTSRVLIDNCGDGNNVAVSDYVTINNVYSKTPQEKAYGSVAKAITGVKTLDATCMGKNAKTSMTGFDFDNVWYTVDNDYPVNRECDQKSDTSFDDSPSGQVWSGKTAENYAGGYGTKENPYQIATAEQLHRMVTVDYDANAYFVLVADILLNDVENDLWKNEWVQSEHLNKPFVGNFNGQGYTIKGMYKSTTDVKCALFPNIGNATICNVHLRDSRIKGSVDKASYAGGIGGLVIPNASVVILGCSVDESVEISGCYVGGIVAANAGSTYIENCYSRAQISAASSSSQNAPVPRVGGIVGDSYGFLSVDACYSIDTVAIDKADTQNCKVYDVYSNIEQLAASVESAQSIEVTVLSKKEMLGEAAKTNMNGFNWLECWKAVENGYPEVLLIEKFGANGTPGEVWSGKKALSYAGGNGTKENPYQIATGEQLYKMVSEHCIRTDKKAYYVLIEDIILNDIHKPNWTENNPNQWHHVMDQAYGFAGHFDGQGHIVSGLYSSANEDKSYSGLIPVITSGAVVENVGLTDSYIVADYSKTSYAAAIVGYIEWYSEDGYEEEDVTIVRNCFADSTTYVESFSAGGIVGGVPSPVKVDNCFFTGRLKGLSRKGAIIGSIWSTGSSITNSYSASQNADAFADGDWIERGTANIYIENAYTYAVSTFGEVTFVAIRDMKGDKAKTSMSGLNFDTVWKTVDGGTPVLRLFNSDKFSDKSIRYVDVDFETNCETISYETVKIEAGDTVVLPTPQRYGYSFDGWYVYEELDVEFPKNSPIIKDTTLYAKWTILGISQDFENYANTEYDYGEDYEYYRPGAFGYNANNVYGGSNSIHRYNNGSAYADFLLNYENSLVPGKEYTMTFWMRTDTENANGTISLVHATWPDIYEPIAGVEKMFEFTGLKSGEWKQYTYTFVAQTEWISVRSTGDASLYFDEFMLVTTGNTGPVKLSNTNINTNTNTNTDSNTNNITAPEKEDSSNPSSAPEKGDSSKPTKVPEKEDAPNLTPYIVVAVLLLLIALVVIICIKRKVFKK